MSADTAHSRSVATLYGAHHPWLRNWLDRRLGNAADAADLAQDTFVRLLGRPTADLDTAPKARAYLKTIANGLCIDLWRRREVEQAWLDSLAARPEAVHPSPEARAVVIDTLMEVGALLAKLPRQTGLAFVLAQVHGLTYREIAAELAVSERTVKTYMTQAMLQCALVEAGLQG